ncbi:MAG: TIGR00159 family protein [Saprospiraceae bacterium]|nr:TIGR00159 family protein [Saprospiraceae bacterium]
MRAIFLFDIGFLNIRIWDIFDVLIVGYLMYLAYRLLKGTVAFNIFVGVVLLYGVWWLVGALKMELLAKLLGQFVSVGVVVVAIIFQPELRRFLLLLGNQTLRGRFQIFNLNSDKNEDNYLEINELKNAILTLSDTHTGALIVLANRSTMLNMSEKGTVLNAQISTALLLSIFNKESPLHDGAVIIAENKILATGVVLPLSENPDLPKDAGLRHRAAVGASETANVTAFIVSEETGNISMAHQGQLTSDLESPTLLKLLSEHFN